LSGPSIGRKLHGGEDAPDEVGNADNYLKNCVGV